MSSIRARTESKSRVFRSSNAARVICKSLTLRELRFAASQQILPSAGNRKPASDRGHWLQPAPCSSRRRSCPGGERGDRQSSVPVEPTRHGHRNRQEDRRVRLQNRVVSTTARRALHTLSRNEKFEFFWCPLPWGSECSGNYQPRGNGKTARGIDSADPSRLQPPRNGKPAGDVARQTEPLPPRAVRGRDYAKPG